MGSVELSAWHEQLDSHLLLRFQHWAREVQESIRERGVKSLELEVLNVASRQKRQSIRLVASGLIQDSIPMGVRLVELPFASTRSTPVSAVQTASLPKSSRFLLDIPMSGIESALAQTLGGEGLAEESSGVLSGTSLEQRLVDWFLEPFATCLAESVAAGLDLDANVGRIVGKVEFDRYFPDAESYFRVGVQMRFRTGNAQLKSVDGELAFSDVALSPLIGCVLGSKGELKDRHELVAVMARSTISPEDFAQIEVGDVIATEVDAHGEFGLEYLGNRVCSVVPGLLHGRKAVRVVQ
jgi:hypothetical protein